jgi:hypothetical protein
MNAGIQSARKQYFENVHRIQSERGVDFATAKMIFKKNGSVAALPATLTIDEVFALAAAKCDEIHGQLESLHRQTSDPLTDLSAAGRSTGNSHLHGWWHGCKTMAQTPLIPGEVVSASRTYRIWCGMRWRCECQSNSAYQRRFWPPAPDALGAVGNRVGNQF